MAFSYDDAALARRLGMNQSNSIPSSGSFSYPEASLAGINPLSPSTPGYNEATIQATADANAAARAAQGTGAVAQGTGSVPNTQGSTFDGNHPWNLGGLNDLPRNPEMMLMDLFGGDMSHVSRGTGLYYQTLPYMANANAIFALSNPNGIGTGPAFESWLRDFTQGMLTPGQSTDTQGLLKNLFNPGAGTILGNYTGLGDPANQVSNTLGLMKAALDQGMHPIYAQAMMAKAALAATQWQRLNAQASQSTAPIPFPQYLGSQQLFDQYR
jgi:hypothetical protein